MVVLLPLGGVQGGNLSKFSAFLRNKWHGRGGSYELFISPADDRRPLVRAIHVHALKRLNRLCLRVGQEQHPTRSSNRFCNNVNVHVKEVYELHTPKS